MPDGLEGTEHFFYEAPNDRGLNHLLHLAIFVAARTRPRELEIGPPDEMLLVALPPSGCPAVPTRVLAFSRTFKWN